MANPARVVAALALRPAGPGDRERLLEIGVAAGPPGVTRESVERALRDHEVWVAARGERVCGWVELSAGRILGLYVDPERTRRGLGGQLLALAERRVCDAGYADVRLSADPQVEAYFLRRGYRRAAQRVGRAAQRGGVVELSKSVAAAVTFDEVAWLYHESRPGYPEAVFEEVVRFSQIPERGRILEVGCGSGRATLPLARRGYRMLCVEPGAKLVDIATAECGGYPDVTFVVARFEDWPSEPAGFDLVLSAQAFHWVDPGTAYAKAGENLRPGGALALFWNQPLPGIGGEVRDALDRVYRERAPQIAHSDATAELAESQQRNIVQRVDATGLFEPVDVRIHPWSERYSADAYVRLMRTHSDHALLDAETRDALLADIREVFEHAGGEVEVVYRTLLLLARRRE